MLSIYLAAEAAFISRGIIKPAKGFENNAGVRAKAGELQRQLAPLINKNVMMRAHLDGSSDYSKYFKMSEPEMFGTKAQDTSSVNGR